MNNLSGEKVKPPWLSGRIAIRNVKEKEASKWNI
jgi:hypothetical protein